MRSEGITRTRPTFDDDTESATEHEEWGDIPDPCAVDPCDTCILKEELDRLVGIVRADFMAYLFLLPDVRSSTLMIEYYEVLGEGARTTCDTVGGTGSLRDEAVKTHVMLLWRELRRLGAPIGSERTLKYYLSAIEETSSLVSVDAIYALAPSPREIAAARARALATHTIARANRKAP